MKVREFNKHLNACRTRTRDGIDMAKLRALPLSIRQGMGHFVIRSRGPVLVELVEGIDCHWLAAMGYLYRTTSRVNADMTFYHTAATTIR